MRNPLLGSGATLERALRKVNLFAAFGTNVAFFEFIREDFFFLAARWAFAGK
jgi:hypothetical protein